MLSRSVSAENYSRPQFASNPLIQMMVIMMEMMLLMGAPQQVMATNLGAYPPLPGVASGVQPHSLYPPLAGVAPMMPSASPYPAPAAGYPQNAMSTMSSSLFPLFQQQQVQPNRPSAAQPLFNGAQPLLQNGVNNGWPQPPAQPSFGAQEHALEGLWQGSGGEMIAIKDSRFLYSDKSSQQFSGYLSIGRDRFQASIPSSKTVANYQYWIKNDKLTVKDEAGRVLYFQRVYR